MTETLEGNADKLLARRYSSDLPPEISPAELYAMVPQSVERDLYLLNGCYYAHVPEIAELQYDKELRERNERVEVRVIRHIDWDPRRFWRLATVWFDDNPVMVVKNAGREGDDHFGRFITDPALYWQMVAYLRGLMSDGPEGSLEVVDPDEQRDDLTRFYSWNEGL